MECYSFRTEINFKTTLSKEMIATEARKMIREEKFDSLNRKKSEKTLVREIEKFRVRLELDRTLNKLETNTVDGKEHRTQVKKSSAKNLLCKKHFEINKKRDTKPIEEMKYNKLNTPPAANKRVKSRTIQVTNELKEAKQIVRSLERNEPQIEKHYSENSSKKLLGEKANQSKTKANVRLKTQGTRQVVQFIDAFVTQTTLQHYWTRWKSFVTARKNKREEEKMWRLKIHNFMQRFNDRATFKIETKRDIPEEKLAIKVKPEKRKRAEIMPKDGNTDDSQTIRRAITESALKSQIVNSEVTRKIDKQLKGKAKLIRQFMVIPEKQREIRESKRKDYPNPEILEIMNRKHVERKQRLMDLQAHKQQLEEDKDRIAKEKYEKQLLKVELEKKKKIREFRKKLHLEKLQQEKKRAEWLRMKELENKGLQYYNHKLLTKFGLAPWWRLTLHRRDLVIRASERDKARMLRFAFARWRQAVAEIEEEKVNKALALQCKHILRNSFTIWRSVVATRHVRMQVAEDWHDHVLTRNMFKDWLTYVSVQQIDLEEKWEQAKSYYRNKLVTTCMKHWMLMPQVMYLERAREIKKKGWREKVQQVLPDFRPFIYTDTRYDSETQTIF